MSDSVVYHKIVCFFCLFRFKSYNCKKDCIDVCHIWSQLLRSVINPSIFRSWEEAPQLHPRPDERLRFCPQEEDEVLHGVQEDLCSGPTRWWWAQEERVEEDLRGWWVIVVMQGWVMVVIKGDWWGLESSRCLQGHYGHWCKWQIGSITINGVVIIFGLVFEIFSFWDCL